MAINQDLPATDSAAALHELIGQDSTATFENDPKFVDSDPTVDASSENLQTRTDRKDVQEMPSIAVKSTADEDDEDEDDLEDEDDEDEDDDLEDDDLEDDDEDEDLDEEEDDEDEDDLDDDDDEDEDEE